MLIPYRYGYMGGTSLSEEDAGDDIDDVSVREPTPQLIGYRPPEAFEPAEIVGDGQLAANMRSYSYDFSYEYADVALVQVALVESSLVLQNVSSRRIGFAETALLGHTISAMLSTFHLYSNDCDVVISNSGHRHANVTFAVEIIVDHEYSDNEAVLCEQVQASLTRALTAGEFSSAFAAAAEESSSAYFAEFGIRDLYDAIDIKSSTASIASRTRVIRGYEDQFRSPTAPPSPSPSSTTKSPVTRRYDATLKVLTSGYSNAHGTTLYPWNYIVEPHKMTKLRFLDACDKNGNLLDDSRTPIWSITFKGTEERRIKRGASGDANPARAQHRVLSGSDSVEVPQVLLERSEHGCDVNLNFTHVSQLYDLAIELPRNSRRLSRSEAAGVDTYVATLMCKYVRREMRTVTSEDRLRYLEAMRIVTTMRLDEGRRMYGGKFANLEYFAVKHIHTEECSPFHGGLSFITSHAAFTLELEQALQSIDPSVTQPYWDYTLDAALLGADWDTAAVFSNDWFGSTRPGGPDHLVTSTFFQDIPVPTNFSKPVRNSYGRVTSTINNDPSHFATRAHTFCGLPITMPLPGCPEMIGCLKAKTLPDLHDCMENELHGDLHAILGGSWDCAYEIAEVVGLAANRTDPLLDRELTINYNSEYQQLLGEIGCKAKPIWNKMWNKKFMKCPLYCSEDTAFANCSCSCPSLDSVCTCVFAQYLPPVTLSQVARLSPEEKWGILQNCVSWQIRPPRLHSAPS